MDKYEKLEDVGEGSFGRVCRAFNKQTGEVVAIKRIKRKFGSWEECLNLPEVKSLRKMNHPNIVKLREVIKKNESLYFVFEYMDCNLYQLIKDRAEFFSEAEVRRWCFKIFQALLYMHRNGYFHRDLKPENILVTKDVIKLADFGSAREICSQPPYTDYVTTRWYRAPEVLLKSTSYNAAVDMWAMGAIMAELFTLRPLFPGSSEADQIYRICSVIGSPNENSWADGLGLANSMNYQLPQFPGVHLSSLIPSASKDAISLITSLCSWDPNKRPTALQVLGHPFFRPCFSLPPSLRPTTTIPPLKKPPPPSVGTATKMLLLEIKNAESVSDTKPLHNFHSVKENAYSLSSDVQRRLKLEMDHQFGNYKNDQYVKSCAKQTQPIRYQPAARNNPIVNQGRALQGGVFSDVTREWLAQVTVSSDNKVAPPRQLAAAAPPQPAPHMIVGWHNIWAYDPN